MIRAALAIATGVAAFTVSAEAAQSVAEDIVRSFGSAARLVVTDCVVESSIDAADRLVVYGIIQSFEGDYRDETGFVFSERGFDCIPGKEYVVLGGHNPPTEPRRRRVSLPLAINDDNMVDFSGLTANWPEDVPPLVPLETVLSWITEAPE